MGLATLNAPLSLNSLTMDMICSLQKRLDQWFKDPEIALIFLQGAGEKAFCAGGDIRQLYQSIQARAFEGADEFFFHEYRLDYSIHVSPKPFVVWGSGIVMGGGIGLMSGAGFRVVTETSKLAMPEINIGLFPDVGGTFFLSRMSHRLGLFLALTAARMNAADAIEVGLADFFVPQTEKENLIKKMIGMNWTGVKAQDEEQLTAILSSFSQRSRPSASEFIQHKKVVETAMTGRSLPELMESFAQAAKENPWLQKAYAGCLKGSPTSAWVIFEQLKRGVSLSLKDVFEMEFVMASQFIRHTDLFEGIRALIVEKDNSPKWSPASFGDVSLELVEEHFRSPGLERKKLL